MVVKVYVSGISGNKEVKKRQQRVLMILDSKNIQYEVIDITEPGKEDDKEFMQINSKCSGGTVSDPEPRHPLPPQIFNDDEYCGDYDQFDLANEMDTLEQFVKVEIPPEHEVNKVEEKDKTVNGNAEPEENIDGEVKDTNGKMTSTKESTVNADSEDRQEPVNGNTTSKEGSVEKTADTKEESSEKELSKDGTQKDEELKKEGSLDKVIEEETSEESIAKDDLKDKSKLHRERSEENGKETSESKVLSEDIDPSASEKEQADKQTENETMKHDENQDEKQAIDQEKELVHQQEEKTPDMKKQESVVISSTEALLESEKSATAE